MYRFFIEEWFADQKEFEDWVRKECGTKYELFSIGSFGYIPALIEREVGARDFHASQIIFKRHTL